MQLFAKFVKRVSKQALEYIKNIHLILKYLTCVQRQTEKF